MNLPMAPLDTPPGLAPEDVPALQAEVRELARERDAVILAHNYQRARGAGRRRLRRRLARPRRQGAATDAGTIAFCGVHFMAETASILSPEKTVLIPDLDAGCSLADSITAEQLRAWQAKHPGAVTVMYVNTTAEVKALTDYCVTSSNAVAVVEHILREHGAETEILFGPDMFLGAYVERMIGRALHVWDGECHVHAGIRPSDIARTRAEHPGADFLIHPECGCSTSVMEYVAAGDVDAEGVHMLSTGGMLDLRAEHAGRGGTAIMATETGMLHPLRMAAPDIDFVAANERASCRYMKMITLTKLRDGLRDGVLRGPRARGDRRARARADRAHGRHRLAGLGCPEHVCRRRRSTAPGRSGATRRGWPRGSPIRPRASWWPARRACSSPASDRGCSPSTSCPTASSSCCSASTATGGRVFAADPGDELAGEWRGAARPGAACSRRPRAGWSPTRSRC